MGSRGLGFKAVGFQGLGLEGFFGTSFMHSSPPCPEARDMCAMRAAPAQCSGLGLWV